VARDEARIDAWIKDVTPGNALRRWYSHDLEKWSEFRARYIAELKHNPAVVELQALDQNSINGKNQTAFYLGSQLADGKTSIWIQKTAILLFDNESFKTNSTV
jgi:uncharacterized protein YeaO (DUF488 family)